MYAGDPAILSAPAAFPLFWGFEKESGGMIRGAVRHMLRRRRERRAMGPAAPPSRRGLWSLSGGLGTLGRAASTVLGERLITDRGIGRIVREDGQWDVDGERAPVLVLAVPPGRAADLLEPLDGRMAGAARDIVMAPIVGVHLGFSSRVAEVPDAFGFLVPRGEGIRTLGVLFPSRMFRDRVPAGGDLLTGFVGGVLDPRALELSDADLVETVLGDLAALVGVERRPDHVHVMRYPAAIPQLTLGHAERMQELRRGLERLRGLLLAGNWQRGVGIKDAVGSGMDAARAALAELAG